MSFKQRIRIYNYNIDQKPTNKFELQLYLIKLRELNDQHKLQNYNKLISPFVDISLTNTKFIWTLKHDTAHEKILRAVTYAIQGTKSQNIKVNNRKVNKHNTKQIQ